MKTVNTIELKTQANRLLRRVSGKHQVIIITRRGHPCAALVPVSDETLADVLWEYSPEVQERLQIAADELRLRKVQSLKAFAKRHGLA